MRHDRPGSAVFPRQCSSAGARRSEERQDARGAAGYAYRRLGIVNIVFFGPSKAGDRGWVLIDAGLPGTKGLIKNAAAERFGSDRRRRSS
jgi:hypothetical protein